MTRTFEVTVEVRLTLTVNDESVINRCVENHDDEGVPQPDVPGGSGWRNTHYGSLDTPEKVAEHLAYNYVVNDRIWTSLDGWADIPVDPSAPAVQYRIDHDWTYVEAREGALGA